MGRELPGGDKVYPREAEHSNYGYCDRGFAHRYTDDDEPAGRYLQRATHGKERSACGLDLCEGNAGRLCTGARSL